MSVYFTNPTHHPEDTGVGLLERTVDNAMFLAATSNLVPIGAIEKGGMIISASAYVETLFNGTTPAITLGSSGTPAGVMASADIIPGTAGFKAAPAAGALMGVPMTADTVIYAKLTQTNTTAGKATFTVQFAAPRDRAAGIRNNPPGVSY